MTNVFVNAGVFILSAVVLLGVTIGAQYVHPSDIVVDNATTTSPTPRAIQSASAQNALTIPSPRVAPLPAKTTVKNPLPPVVSTTTQHNSSEGVPTSRYHRSRQREDDDD